jgi:hypothetical protein
MKKMTIVNNVHGNFCYNDSLTGYKPDIASESGDIKSEQ